MHIPSTLAKNALGPLTDPGLLTPLSPIYIYIPLCHILRVFLLVLSIFYIFREHYCTDVPHLLVMLYF